MKTTDTSETLRVGDVISGLYHGVAFVGVVSGYDGGCHVYVDFPAPYAAPVVYGSARNGLFLHRDDLADVGARLVSRPASAPELAHLPASCVGGVALRGAAHVPTLTEIAVAGKAAVARQDHAAAEALRALYRSVRDAAVAA